MKHRGWRATRYERDGASVYQTTRGWEALIHQRGVLGVFDDDDAAMRAVEEHLCHTASPSIPPTGAVGEET